MGDAARSLVERYALPPAEIEIASLTHVARALAHRTDWSEDIRLLIHRMIYAAGDLSLAEQIHVHPHAVDAGVAALRNGRPMVTDGRMVEAGLDRGRLAALGSHTSCAIDAPDVARSATDDNLPRAVFAMRSLARELDGGVAVIGTAPTALLAVLDLVDRGAIRPALIIGTPVGFTAAAESKRELLARDVPYVTIAGTRGGAALAAAAANGLLRLATGPTKDSVHGQ